MNSLLKNSSTEFKSDIYKTVNAIFNRISVCSLLRRVLIKPKPKQLRCKSINFSEILGRPEILVSLNTLRINNFNSNPNNFCIFIKIKL